jgi:hypothetical protein
MKKMTSVAMVACSFLTTGWLLSQQAKPNFSGVWKLNKEKSVLTFPTMRQPGGGEAAMDRSGGRGGGGGAGGGGVSFGIPQMGGPGGGGPGRGGPHPGGRAGRDPKLMGVGETVEIAHEEPNFVIKTMSNADDKAPFTEWRLTTDGKKKETTLPDGSTLKSKSTWKKDRLTTKSTVQSPTSFMEMTENRTLSNDGKTMTVEFTMASMFMLWKRTLVYDKADAPAQ